MKGMKWVWMAGAAVLAAGLPVRGAEIFSRNVDSTWDDAFCWVGGVVPGSNDVAVFESLGAASRQNELGSDLSWQGIRFSSANLNRPVVLNQLGTEKLTLGSAGIVQQETTNGNDLTKTINVDVILGASQAWNVHAGVAYTLKLVVNGDISGAVANTLTKSGGDRLTLTGNNTYAGGTIISAGTLFANSGNALGTGGISVADGATLILGSNSAVNDAAELILGSAATFSMNFTGEETVGGLSLDGGSTWVDAGTYDATQLGGLGSGTYSGTGSLTVIPEPGTLGLFSVTAAGAFLLRRFRM